MPVHEAVFVHRAGADLASDESCSWQTDAVVGWHVDAAGKGNCIDAVRGPNKTGSQLVEGRVEILFPHFERLVDVPIHVDDGVA